MFLTLFLSVGIVAASITVLKRTEKNNVTEREWMHIEAALTYCNGDMQKSCKKWMEILMKFPAGKNVADAFCIQVPFSSPLIYFP